MRIAIVGGKSFAAPAERQVLLLANALAELGDSVDIYVRDDSIASPFPLQPNVRPQALPVAKLHDYMRKRVVRNYDLIHSYSPRALPLLNAMKLATQKTLLVHHEDDENGLMRSVWPSVLQPLAPLLSTAAATVNVSRWPYVSPGLVLLARAGFHVAHEALTPALAREVARQWHQPCATVMSSTDLDLFSPRQTADRTVRERLGDRFVVMYAGFLWRAVKEDVRLLVDGFFDAVSLGSSAILALLGGRSPDFDLDELIDGRDRARVIELGEEPDFRRVPAKLACADVLVQPGAPSEFNRLRLPSKLNDYMAMGKPVVTFSVGFGEMLTPGRHALLTKTPAPRELAGCLLQLEQSPSLRAELSAGARSFAETHFDPRHNAIAMRGIYLDLVRRAPSSGTLGSR